MIKITCNLICEITSLTFLLESEKNVKGAILREIRLEVVEPDFDKKKIYPDSY